MYILTPVALQKICPSLTGAPLANILQLLTTIPQQYGIDTAKKFCPFLANIVHESADFQKLSENLNYAADKIRGTFGSHRISDYDVMKYGRTSTQKANQEMIANLVYGGEFGKSELGNNLPGDGWLFRGSGYMQITGRRNISLFTLYYNQLTGKNIKAEEMALELRSNSLIAMHGACWFFAIYKKLIPLALNDQFTEICKRINGGKVGLDKRKSLFTECKINIKDAE